MAFAQNMKQLITQIAKDNNMPFEQADEIVKGIVKVVDEGALGQGPVKVATVMKITRKKYNIKSLIQKTASETGYEEFVVAGVVKDVTTAIGNTVSQGGMPALSRMLRLMKSPQKITDSDLEDINKIIIKSTENAKGLK